MTDLYEKILIGILTVLFTSLGWCIYIDTNEVPTTIDKMKAVISVCEKDLPRSMSCEIVLTAKVKQ